MVQKKTEISLYRALLVPEGVVSPFHPCRLRSIRPRDVYTRLSYFREVLFGGKKVLDEKAVAGTSV